MLCLEEFLFRQNIGETEEVPARVACRSETGFFCSIRMAEAFAILEMLYLFMNTTRNANKGKAPKNHPRIISKADQYKLRNEGTNMNQPPLISVVIPVYNIETYLERCLQSVADQDYERFEAILVDDGSTDSSAQICDQWSEKDTRFKCIHKANGGLSDARNVGISLSSGEYITFIDGDDWVDSSLLSTLWQGIEQGASISACGFYTVRNGSPKAWRKPQKGYRILSAVEAVEDMMYAHTIDASAWAKLFHRSCFDYFLFPKGHLYEEVAITYRMMLTQSKVAITTLPMYFYVKRPESIVTSSYSECDMDMLRYSQEMLQYAETERSELIPAAKRRIVYACFFLLKSMGQDYRIHPSEVSTIRSAFGQYKAGVFRDPEVSLRDKVAIVLLSCGVGTFETFWTLYSCLTGRRENG